MVAGHGSVDRYRVCWFFEEYKLWRSHQDNQSSFVIVYRPAVHITTRGNHVPIVVCHWHQRGKTSLEITLE